MNLPVEEIDKYTQMFNTMDKDNDGNLSLEELKEGFRINGHPVPEEEIKMLLEAVSASITICILIQCRIRMTGVLATES